MSRKRSEVEYLIGKRFGTQNPLQLVMDTDPGCDDAVAMIAALKSPHINVRGIMSIGGNVSPLATQQNARAICALVGREDVPVYVGSDRPLYKQGKPLLADHIHGEDGLHGLKYPALGPAPLLDSAHDYLIEETLRSSRKSIVTAAIGPLTNIAKATLLDLQLPKRVGRVYIMGGGFRKSDNLPVGNITPYAEFNTHCDPDAAKIVYTLFEDIVTIPMNITTQTLHDPLLSQWLRATGGEKGANVANMMDAYAKSSFEHDGLSAFHDFNVIAAIEEPDIYTYKRGRVLVATKGEREGETTFIPDEKGNVLVADTVNLARYRACKQRMLGNYTLEVA